MSGGHPNLRNVASIVRVSHQVFIGNPSNSFHSDRAKMLPVKHLLHSHPSSNRGGSGRWKKQWKDNFSTSAFSKLPHSQWRNNTPPLIKDELKPIFVRISFLCAFPQFCPRFLPHEGHFSPGPARGKRRGAWGEREGSGGGNGRGTRGAEGSAGRAARLSPPPPHARALVGAAISTKFL